MIYSWFLVYTIEYNPSLLKQKCFEARAIAASMMQVYRLRVEFRGTAYLCFISLCPGQDKEAIKPETHLTIMS